MRARTRWLLLLLLVTLSFAGVPAVATPAVATTPNCWTFAYDPDTHAMIVVTIPAGQGWVEARTVAGFAKTECNQEMTVVGHTTTLNPVGATGQDPPAPNRSGASAVANSGCPAGQMSWSTTGNGEWVKYETSSGGTPSHTSGSVSSKCSHLTVLEGPPKP